MYHLKALQGAFAEHQTAINKLKMSRKIRSVQVRTPEDLTACDALIIPGGGDIFIDDVQRQSHTDSHAKPRVHHDRFIGSLSWSSRALAKLFED